MTDPVFMTEKTLNALKGWPSPSAVDFHTEFDPAVLTAVGRVVAGTVVRLNSAGRYELGVGVRQVMPMFLFANSDDPDIQNYGGDPAAKKGAWIPISPTGQAMALPANGAYELVSTAYDTSKPETDFAPNVPLSALDTGATAGLLYKGTYQTHTICGICSRGIVDNGYGYKAVAFWPWIMWP